MAIRGVALAEALAAIDGQADANGGSDLVNVRAATRMLRLDELHYRGRRYRVPPVGYTDGLELYDLQQRVEHERKRTYRIEDRRAALQATLALLEAGVAIFARLVDPLPIDARWHERLAAWWRRVRRVNDPNPFATCTEAEWADLIAFFCLCRMTSSVPPIGTRAPAVVRQS